MSKKNPVVFTNVSRELKKVILTLVQDEGMASQSDYLLRLIIKDLLERKLIE